jgi:hypothetical protein
LEEENRKSRTGVKPPDGGRRRHRPSRIRWMAADFGFEEIDVSRPKVRARRINPEILSHLI